MENSKIMYLDNAATTQAHPEVVGAMVRSFETEYANPSSLYDLGIADEKRVKAARATIAGAIHGDPREIIFTSGGTEGDNFLIKGIIENQRPEKMKTMGIVTTAIEHPAVKEVFAMYEACGIHVTWLDVDGEGRIDLKQLEDAVDANTCLVSVIGVNNELGTVQDLKAIGAVIKKKNPQCFFHSDYVQGFMKVPVDVAACQLDGLTLCGHKINGPKGIGAVYLRRGSRIKPLMLGGGQESGLRSGTENVQSIVGFEKAIQIWQDPQVMARIAGFRDYVARELTALEEVRVNGPADACPSVMSVSIKGLRGEVLLHSLEARKVYISTGSACSSHKKEKNAVLKAINLDRSYMEGTIRVSFSALTTREEVEGAVAIMKEEIVKLRKFMNRL